MERRESQEGASEVYKGAKGVHLSLWLNVNLHMQKAQPYEVLQRTGDAELWIQWESGVHPKRETEC